MTALRLGTLRIVNPRDEQLLAELAGDTDEVFEVIEGALSLDDVPSVRASDFVTSAKQVSTDVEFGQAIAAALKPIFAVRPALARDPGFWTWLSVKAFRDYSLHRWCDGYLLDELVSAPSPEMLSHLRFGSPSNLKSYTRNSIARLYIVFRAIDQAGVKSRKEVESLASTLLVARTHQEIFERLMGLDSELVVLVARHLGRKRLAGAQLGRDAASSRRRFLKNLNLALGTVAIETLESPEKQLLIGDL